MTKVTTAYCWGRASVLIFAYLSVFMIWWHYPLVVSLLSWSLYLNYVLLWCPFLSLLMSILWWYSLLLVSLPGWCPFSCFDSGVPCSVQIIVDQPPPLSPNCRRDWVGARVICAHTAIPVVTPHLSSHIYFCTFVLLSVCTFVLLVFFVLTLGWSWSLSCHRTTVTFAFTAPIQLDVLFMIWFWLPMTAVCKGLTFFLIW